MRKRFDLSGLAFVGLLVILAGIVLSILLFEDGEKDPTQGVVLSPDPPPSTDIVHPPPKAD